MNKCKLLFSTTMMNPFNQPITAPGIQTPPHTSVSTPDAPTKKRSLDSITNTIHDYIGYLSAYAIGADDKVEKEVHKNKKLCVENEEKDTIIQQQAVENQSLNAEISRIKAEKDAIIQKLNNVKKLVPHINAKTMPLRQYQIRNRNGGLIVGETYKTPYATLLTTVRKLITTPRVNNNTNPNKIIDEVFEVCEVNGWKFTGLVGTHRIESP